MESTEEAKNDHRDVTETPGAHHAYIAFMDRFERTKEKLMVNDALQEMARNGRVRVTGDAFDAVPYTGITKRGEG